MHLILLCVYNFLSHLDSRYSKKKEKILTICYHKQNTCFRLYYNICSHNQIEVVFIFVNRALNKCCIKIKS